MTFDTRFCFQYRLLFLLNILGKINGPPYSVSFDMYEEILVPVGFILVDGPTVVENEMAHESRGNGKTMIASWKKI